MNNVSLIGNLATDVDLKQIGDGERPRRAPCVGVERLWGQEAFDGGG